MKKKMIALLLAAALLLLVGCGAGEVPQDPGVSDASPSPTVNTVSLTDTKAPVDDPPAEAKEPYMGVYAYSVTIPGENWSPDTEKVGCFWVTDSVAGVSVFGVGGLEFSRADASTETAAESWQDVLEDDCFAYLNDSGESVTLSWHETRGSIEFKILSADHSAISGTAYLVRPVDEIPGIENMEPPPHTDPDQIKPYLGTYFYDGYYDEQGVYLQRYGYITVSNCDDTMKLEYAGALGIGRTGIAWSSVLENTQISYSTGYSAEIVNLKWNCDDGELVFMIYDSSTGSAVATGVATRVDGLSLD